MKKIYITGQEVKEHLELYKRGSALSSVKKILENPKRLSELGFSLEQFKQIDEDIKQINMIAMELLSCFMKDKCLDLSDMYQKLP